MEIKNIVLGIAVIILTIFVAVYGIGIFYPIVEYENYCGEFKTAEIIETQERCMKIGGQWTADENIRCVTTPCIQGYCDRDYTCRQNYETVQKSRVRSIFYISIPLGVLLIFIGGYLFYLEAVGAGLMGGGVGTIIYGAGGYWQYGDNLFRFIISLLGLIAVIYISYWLNRKFVKKK